MKEQNEDRGNIELRSEKVRSIVGQIPSSLIHYGTTIIALVLLCVFSIAYFLPYKQIYFGTAVIYEMPSRNYSDNIEREILLNFREKRPDTNIQESQIVFLSDFESIEGSLLKLSPVRDTLGRQEAICRMPLHAMKRIENREVDFFLTIKSKNFLTLFFSKSFQKEFPNTESL